MFAVGEAGAEGTPGVVVGVGLVSASSSAVSWAEGPPLPLPVLPASPVLLWFFGFEESADWLPAGWPGGWPEEESIGMSAALARAS